MSHYLLSKVTEPSYRPDIDGLRALAVLSVIFYHVGIVGFTGGFVGVDVFFVISGYLITRNIASDLQKNKFSFSSFYLRRARRLLPALIFTIAISLFVGGLIFFPFHLTDFALSAVFSIFPVSNIYFWKTAGYFSSDAILKPLLHMWSLSVEEQFYLVWPSLLLFLFALKRSWLSIAILLTLGIASLTYAEFELGADSNKVFFLLQFRVVEFIGGVLCVWLVNYRPKSKIICEIGLATGLLMIAYSIHYYNNATPFPGFNVLLPVLGTMLVIYAGAPQYLGRMLTNRLAVGTGLISYSLYLVHWPILVFLTYLLEDKWYIPSAVVISSLILATLMYFYVETPFRKPAQMSLIYKTKSFVLFCGVFSTILFVLSYSAWKNGGWTWRYPLELRVLSEDIVLEKAKRFSLYQKICSIKGWDNCSNLSNSPDVKNVIILGDSHAVDALNTLYAISEQPNYVLNSLGACPLMVRGDYKIMESLIPRHPNIQACISLNEDRFDEKLLKKADLIVINVLFDWYKPEHLERAVNAIRQKTSSPIWVFGNYMVLQKDLPALIFKHSQDFLNSPDAKIEWLGGSTFIYEESLKELSQKLNFTFISKKELLCPQAALKPCPIRLNDGKLFTYDKHHLSLSASELLGKRLQLTYPELTKALRIH